MTDNRRYDIQIEFDKAKLGKCQNCTGVKIIHLVKDLKFVKEYFICFDCAEKMVDRRVGIWKT